MDSQPKEQALWLVRHGTKHLRTWNPDFEWPLSDLGKRQAECVASFFEEEFRDSAPQLQMLVSPFYRCVCTAKPISEKLNLPMNLEPGLWESRQPKNGSDSLRAGYLKDVNVNTDYEAKLVPSLPETGPKYYERVLQLAQILNNTTESLILVSHGSVISGLLFHLLEANNPEDVPAIRECSISKLYRFPGGSWKLEFGGEIDHLSETGWDTYSFQNSQFWKDYHNTYAKL